jgi:hypothetical protein
MTVTLVPGQLVQQNLNNIGQSRVWELLDRYEVPRPDDRPAMVRWNIRLVTTAQPRDSRAVGYISSGSEAWLNSECFDWAPPRIDPPCGDGVQVVIIRSPDFIVDESEFTTAADTIRYVMDHVTGDEHLWAEWFGYRPDDSCTPDMTARWNGDEVLWADCDR